MPSVELWVNDTCLTVAEVYKQEPTKELPTDMGFKDFKILIYVDGTEVDCTAGFMNATNKRHYDQLYTKLYGQALKLWCAGVLD